MFEPSEGIVVAPLLEGLCPLPQRACAVFSEALCPLPLRGTATDFLKETAIAPLRVGLRHLLSEGLRHLLRGTGDISSEGPR